MIKKICMYIKKMISLMDTSIIFISILYLISDLFYIYFIIIVSAVLQKITDTFLLRNIMDMLIFLLLSMILFILLKIFVNKMLAKIKYKIGHRIREKLIINIVNSYSVDLQNHGSGKILELVEQDVENVINSFQNNFLAVLSGIIQFIAVLLYGLMHSLTMVIAIVVLTSFSALLPKFFSKKIYNSYESITKKQENSREGIKKIILSLQDVYNDKANRFIEKLAEKEFEILNEKQYEYEKKVILFDIISAGIGLLTTIFWIGLGVVLIYKEMITVSVLFVFMNLSDEINWPFISLPYMVTEFSNALVSIDKIDKQVEDLQNSYKNEKIKVLDLKGKRMQFILNNINYSYKNNEVLSDINRQISFPGKYLFNGKSGCGKSTLLKMLSGLYLPKTGEVILAIDDIKIKGEDITRYISYVEQSLVVIDGTIEENILFGEYWDKADVIKKKQFLEDLIKKTSLNDFYCSLVDGKETLIGTNGRRLSSGEMQRISIARALAKPHAILIMDEPTAHLDADTEDRIMTNILSSEENIIMVTHRSDIKEKFKNELITIEM